MIHYYYPIVIFLKTLLLVMNKALAHVVYFTISTKKRNTAEIEKILKSSAVFWNYYIIDFNKKIDELFVISACFWYSRQTV
jgi:hypothetical protein